MAKREKICCIYKLTNTTNGKIYIGQTVDYHRRMNEYKNRKSSLSDSSKYKIMEIIESVGFDKFKSEIVIRCDKDTLDFFEMYYINKYCSYKDDIGYNSFHAIVTGSILDIPSKKKFVSDSTREKMSKSHKDLKESANTKRKKSHKVYAIKDNEFIISDSGKLLADYLGKSKDIINHSIRNPNTVNGYYVYYADKNKRSELLTKILKQSTRNKKYIKLLNYLDNSSIETIENDYNVIKLSYDNE